MPEKSGEARGARTHEKERARALVSVGDRKRRGRLTCSALEVRHFETFERSPVNGISDDKAEDLRILRINVFGRPKGENCTLRTQPHLLPPAEECSSNDDFGLFGPGESLIVFTTE